MMVWSFSKPSQDLSSAWVILRKAELAGHRIGAAGLSAILMESEQRELSNFELRLLTRLVRGPMSVPAFNVSAVQAAAAGGAKRARRLLQQAAATQRLYSRSVQQVE